MAYGVRVVPFTTPTATGAQSITIASGLGSDEQIKGYLLFVSTTTTLDANENTGRISVGMSDGTSQLACAAVHRHNQAAGTAHAGWRADREHVIEIINGASSARLGSATHTSLGVGTISINYDDAPDAAYKGFALLFYGGHLDCNVTHFASHASLDTAQATTDPGWRPDGILAMSVGHPFGRDADVDNFGDEGELCFGGSGRLSAITQSCGAVVFEHNQNPTSVGGIVRSNRILTRLASAAGVVSEGTNLEVTSYTTTGFEVTNRSSAGAMVGGYFSFRVRAASPPRVYCEAQVQDTNALGVEDETSPGFLPVCVIGYAAVASAVDTILDSQGRFSVGAATASEEATVGLFSQDNQATSNSAGVASSSAWINTNGAAGASDYILANVALDSSGFDFEVTDTSGVDRAVGFMAIESVAVPGDIPRERPSRGQRALLRR